MPKEFNMQIINGFDHIIEEKGNSYIALRKLTWSEGSSERLDIRKYMVDSDGNEVIGKGVGFLTEDGPHELTKVLVETGYGKTEDILKGIKDRKDFMPSLNKILSGSEKESVSKDTDMDFNEYKEEEEEYYDPRELVLE